MRKRLKNITRERYLYVSDHSRIQKGANISVKERVKKLRCSFCGSREEVGDDTGLCQVCWSGLKNDMTPPIDFSEYFSSGLEGKLENIDSLLFNLPDNYFLWYLKGHLEHELGESKKGLRSVSTSISYKEDFGDSWIRLGLIHSDMHRESDALEDFRKGLRFPLSDPSNLIDAGTSLQASDHPELAAKVLQRALDLVPDNDRAMVALAKVLYRTGELEQAKETMERALDLYPHNEEVLRGMAQIVLKMGDLDSGMEIYSRILDQHPNDFEALLAKAEIHLRMGNMGRAMKSYRAVKEMDVHISWPGILRFILSSLRELIERNENLPSYRDDLKKEFENIRVYLDDIDERIDTSQGPEILEELESIVKIIENLRLSLKEKMGQFRELLNKYQVENSFHKHLETKVTSLENYISSKRFFDGKQISLELSPFLSDLGTMDLRTEARLRKETERKLNELDEAGLSNREVSDKMKKVRDMENEGNIEGAMFMLKEIEISIQEHWQDAGRDYFDPKVEEIRELLETGKDQFDTSRLRRKFRQFKDMFDRGPRAIREAYLDLTRSYAEDSERFYQKDLDRILREIQYKIIIMEKDGMDMAHLRKELKKLRNGQKDEKVRAMDLHPDATDLLNSVTDVEKKQNVSRIRSRLADLDRLLGDADALGLDEEVARNVEPVRRVIERSLKNENYRLAGILTGEVNENVEKLLRENYIDELGRNLENSREEMERLRSLSVEDPEWDSLLQDAEKRLGSDLEGTPLIPVVSILADLDTGIRDFYVERLPEEIDTRTHIIRSLIDEGEGFGFDLGWEKRRLDDLERRTDEISSLELLEESVSFEDELEIKIRDLLADLTNELNIDVRKKVEVIGGQGATRKEMMEVLSLVNKAEVLLENGSERDAHRSARESIDLLESVREKILSRKIEECRKQTEDLIGASEEVGIDLDEKYENLHSIIENEEMSSDEKLESITDIHGRILDSFMTSVMYSFDDLEARSEELLTKTEDLFPEEERKAIKRSVTDLEDAIRKEDIDRIPEELNLAQRILDEATEKGKEKAYLAQCSLLVEKAVSLDDDRGRDIVKRTQDLAGTIKEGGMEDADRKIKELRRELSQLDSLIQMNTIESMLKEIEDLDDLSREIFDQMDDELFPEQREEVAERIRYLIDSTTKLYNEPEKKTVEEISVKVSEAKEQIMNLENRWRAYNRLLSLEKLGAFDRDIKDELLFEDLQRLRSLYENGEFVRFFRIWERIEGKMEAMRKDIPQSKEHRPESASDEILIRGKKQKKKAPGKGSMKGMMGIQKLARDMGEKRKLLDEREQLKGSETPDEEEKEKDQDIDVAGIARLIAGDRIKKLKEKGSDSIDSGNDDPLPWSKNRSMDVKGLSGMMDEIEGMDEKASGRSIEKSAEKARKKLEEFYGKLPENLPLTESMSIYGRGIAHMEKGDHPGALKEFRMAISSAIKMTKLHTEIIKALRSLDRELSNRRKIGKREKKAEKVLINAENAMKEGRLADTATMIKVIKNEIFN